MDMSEGYDRIEWDFLRAVLMKMGFCDSWVDLVMACVTLVQLNICLSGRKVSSISLEKGLRQGNPLSPYLFILVAEVFSKMLNKSFGDKSLKGIKLSNHCPVLSHTFFANDALLFMNANVANCCRLSHLMHAYCTASGQQVNLSKSGLIFTKNTPAVVRDEVNNILGIPLAEDPEKYLGIPNVWVKSKQQALAYVKERVGHKVQGWRRNLLSFACREVIIKAVVNAIPIYPMNCFKFPKKTCKDLDV